MTRWFNWTTVTLCSIVSVYFLTATIQEIRPVDHARHFEMMSAAPVNASVHASKPSDPGQQVAQN